MKLIFLTFCLVASLFCKEKHFVVIICSRNNEHYVKENLDSVFNQQYKQFRVIYIDDASTDKTAEMVKNYIKKHNLTHQCIFISNPVRTYKMHNLYHAVHSCKDNEIIVELDGDDSFFDTGVLSYLNHIYQNKEIWMTYGGIITKPHASTIQPRPLPKKIVQEDTFRKNMHKYWIFMALRSFYAGLFKKIERESLMYKGTFFQRGSDMLQMIPMFEMAGERFFCIQKPVYIYNLNTGEHDFRQDPSTQSKASMFARQKKRYHRLEKAPFTSENL